MTARTHTRTAALRGAWILAGLLTAPLLAGSAWAQAAPEFTRCPATPFGDPLTGPMWNGWGGDTNNTRFQPAAAAGLTAADVPRLALKWAMGFPSGEFVSSQQTVVGGRIYIGTGPGGAMSLDAATGCVHWTFRAHAIVRTAITIGRVSGSTPPRYTAFFADLQANVYAIDAETGVHLWTKRADLHPQARITGAPTFYEGRLYVPVSSLEEAAAGSPTYECCTFRGNVVAYDAVTGQEVWRTYIIDEKPVPTKKNARGVQQWGPAGAAVWNAPTIDAKRGVLYVATGDAYTSPAADSTDSVVAMDLKTGKKVWVKQLTANDAWITGCADSRPTNPSINWGPTSTLHSPPSCARCRTDERSSPSVRSPVWAGRSTPTRRAPSCGRTKWASAASGAACCSGPPRTNSRCTSRPRIRRTAPSAPAVSQP